MSRYFGLYGPGTEQGRAFANDPVRKNTNIQRDGTRWRGGSRQWGRSLMDQAELSRQASDYYRKYQTGGPEGPVGVYNLAVMDEAGNVVKTPQVMNIGGKMFKSSDKGRLRILDSEYLNSEIEAFKEVVSYQETIVQAILVDDQTAFLIIGGTEAQAKVLLEKGGGDGDLAVEGLAGSQIDVDATPSHIRYLDPTGTEYARAIAKIRMIVAKLGIIVNEEGGTLRGSGVGLPGQRSKDSGNERTSTGTQTDGGVHGGK